MWGVLETMCQLLWPTSSPPRKPYHDRNCALSDHISHSCIEFYKRQIGHHKRPALPPLPRCKCYATNSLRCTLKESPVNSLFDKFVHTTSIQEALLQKTFENSLVGFPTFPTLLTSQTWLQETPLLLRATSFGSLGQILHYSEQT